jgi:chromosomal replication initiation ATPase DnaA
MHHSTVLHSIRKIEAMRRVDTGLNRTIAMLIEASAR